VRDSSVASRTVGLVVAVVVGLVVLWLLGFVLRRLAGPFSILLAVLVVSVALYVVARRL